MFAPIMRAVCGQLPMAVPAQLAGYQRYRVKSRVFPGIIVDANGLVSGVLYRDLTPKHMQLLDDYESDFYQRIEVMVRTQDAQSELAFTYVIPENARRLLTAQPWDPDQFVRHELAGYVQHLQRGVRVT